MRSLACLLEAGLRKSALLPQETVQGFPASLGVLKASRFLEIMDDKARETSESSQCDSDPDIEFISISPPHKRRHTEDTSQSSPEVEGESQREDSSLDESEGATSQDTSEQPMEIGEPSVEAMAAPAVVADSVATGWQIINPIIIPDKRQEIQQLIQYYEEVFQLLEDVKRIMRVEKLFVQFILQRMRRLENETE
ncbi:uncharacterized protein RHO17_003904 [Thomomys bottae]